MSEINYEQFIRERITELRLKKNVSEHRMSLDLDKSGSYIRGITSGAAMPSVRELFNIIEYLDVSVGEFFAPLEQADTPYAALCERLRRLSDEDISKVSTLVDWIDAQ
ncbi:MAG: helix-turn-helix transcriptional regulator [Ruminococcaceae bacterium]|nr:helix-turn-helix transcriptional regulator [Oscillospiraceae bacterium]